MGPKIGGNSAIWLLLASAVLAQSPAPNEQQIQAHARRAGEFLKQNRPDLAIPEFKAIVSLDPNNVDAQGNLGVLLYFRDDYAQAAPHLRAALKLRPGLAKIQALLGMSEKRTGDNAHAESDLSEAFARTEEEKLKFQAGMELIEIYDGSGDSKKAAAVIGVLSHLEPSNPALQYTAYRIYSTLADEAALSLAMVAPGSALMHQLQAHELARQTKNEDAIAHYRAALKLDPHLPGAHYELGEMLKLTGDDAGAEMEYRAALAENAFDEKAECRLGELAFRSTGLKDASAHFARALQLQPNDVDAGLGQAKVLIAMEQPDEAANILERMVKLEPFDAALHYHLATVYRSLSRVADSRRELAEFQKLKDMKEKLKQTYRDMRIAAKPDRLNGSEGK